MLKWVLKKYKSVTFWAICHPSVTLHIIGFQCIECYGDGVTDKLAVFYMRKNNMMIILAWP